MKLSELAVIMGGELIGNDADVGSFSINTRTLQFGDVYFAILGEQHDGHEFIQQAIERGASCLVVNSQQSQHTQIIVADTTIALQKLSAYWRDQSRVQVIAVTGSCGKTTTRAFLECVFGEAGDTHASVGSFNNHIGVPLTLLGLKPQHDYLIAEIGANHLGEIAALAPLVRPDVAIITNVAPSHLEGFGTLENIATEKAAIYTGLTDAGTAIINADDAFADYWRTLNKDRKIITFGVQSAADIVAKDIEIDPQGLTSFTLVMPQAAKRITLKVMGEHNVKNALAAAAAGYALGLSMEQITAGLEIALPEKRRLVEQTLPMGAQLIDDTYNANPLSTKAAMQLLVQRTGKPILVFADMVELGEDAVALHTCIGEQAKELGVDTLYAYGDLAKYTTTAFGNKGFYFDDKDALIKALQASLSKDQVILVKGSNSMKMNEVVAGLVNFKED